MVSSKSFVDGVSRVMLVVQVLLTVVLVSGKIAVAIFPDTTKSGLQTP